jgi:peptidoglycan-N-acetylglucosamine deacetylase
VTDSVASLSLDLDNHWSYLKTHGDEAWRGFPSYLDRVVPHILDLCERQGITITVFVVGQDAALPKNGEALAMLGASRHEIGNHSFHHEPWLHLRSRSEIFEEITMAEQAIEQATGERPTGFRGPGFSVSRSTLEVLNGGGYVYDASTLPTFIGPLARAYYLRTAPLSDEERQRRGKLFGTIGEGFRRIKPYRWEMGSEDGLVEIPVTTMPILRIPFHVTYLLYLSRYSKSLARGYLSTGLALCRLTGVEPSILLHSLDLLGGDEVEGLDFFPGMQMAGDEKRRLVGEFVEMIGRGRDVLAMGQHAARLTDTNLRLMPTTSMP